jgi:hypothetical protein
MLAYTNIRKKYKTLFKENKELENPTYQDVLTMDLIYLDEINDIIDDIKKYLENIINQL